MRFSLDGGRTALQASFGKLSVIFGLIFYFRRHVLKESDLIETVLSGLRLIGFLCLDHNDVEIVAKTVKEWSYQLVCASKNKERNMKTGLEYAIKILEKGAVRHNYYASDDYLKADRDVQFRHQCQAEACSGAAKLLKRKLRSVIKESQPQPSNKASDKCLIPDDRVKCSSCEGNGFRSFIDYCKWDASPARSWNGGIEDTLC